MTQTLTHLKAITFKNKHEVLLSCYFHRKLDTKYKYNDSRKMKKGSFIIRISQCHCIFRWLPVQEDIWKCVRCLMTELVDGMVNETVGNVKELYCDFKVCTMNVRETEGAIKNGQSRDTGNTGHTSHRTKTDKTTKHNTTQKLRRWATRIPPKTEGEPKCSRRISSPCL